MKDTNRPARAKTMEYRNKPHEIKVGKGTRS